MDNTFDVATGRARYSAEDVSGLLDRLQEVVVCSEVDWGLWQYVRAIAQDAALSNDQVRSSLERVGKKLGL